MGTDIHMYIEVLECIQEKLKWVNADDWRINRYHLKYPSEDTQKFKVEHIYSNRNYGVFAILADMRNDDGWDPISQPRGLPPDLSEEVKAIWDLDGEHTPSWLTLREILAYDWTKTVNRTRMVSKETAEAYRKDGTLPTSWCGWTNQESYEYLTWQTALTEIADDFLKTVIPRLKKEAQGLRKWDRETRKYEPEENYYDHVRIVFWFDS